MSLSALVRQWEEDGLFREQRDAWCALSNASLTRDQIAGVFSELLPSIAFGVGMRLDRYPTAEEVCERLRELAHDRVRCMEGILWNLENRGRPDHEVLADTVRAIHNRMWAESDDESDDDMR